MKVGKRYLVLCLVLVGICIIGVNCVDVKAPLESGTSEVVALGGSDGYVMLLHPNGKFYVVELETGNIREVTGLPTVSFYLVWFSRSIEQVHIQSGSALEPKTMEVRM
jgi:hypothetical protein